MPQTYVTHCFNCLSEFDADEAIWCSCNPQRPTKVCPFCLGCFCAADDSFKDAFWQGAPSSLREEIETLSQSRMLIGEMLVRSGIITTTQLLEALNRQKVDGRRLGEILVDSGALTADRLERFLKSQHTVTAIDVSRARVDAMMIRRLGVNQCIAEKILPLEAEAFRDRHIMTLAMADPSNSVAVERVMNATGYQVIPGAAPGDAIVSVIRSIFPPGSDTSPEPPPRPTARPSADPGCAHILLRANHMRASHVHLQDRRDGTQVFYRIDGTLYVDRAGNGQAARPAKDAFKLLAGIEPGAKPPRCGRGVVKVEGVEQDVLVRSSQAAEGEEVCVKILDPMAFPPRLDELALPPEALERLYAALDLESGLVVVSAPPLSGASYTFYALVTEAAARGRALALVESPRAVMLTDALQEEYFPEEPRSLPDAIRRATASGAGVLAVGASSGLTRSAEIAGLPQRMLVICKVESRSLPDALLRLVAGGYPASDLGAVPTLVTHQRLVRRLCQVCRTESADGGKMAAALGLGPDEALRIKLWRASGCDECGQTPGYRGRSPLLQTLRPDAKVAQAVKQGSPDALLVACRAAGMTSLRNEALSALSAGLTTPEEVTRKQPA